MNFTKLGQISRKHFSSKLFIKSFQKSFHEICCWTLHIQKNILFEIENLSRLSDWLWDWKGRSKESSRVDRMIVDRMIVDRMNGVKWWKAKGNKSSMSKRWLDTMRLHGYYSDSASHNSHRSSPRSKALENIVDFESKFLRTLLDRRIYSIASLHLTRFQSITFSGIFTTTGILTLPSLRITKVSQKTTKMRTIRTVHGDLRLKLPNWREKAF